MVKSLKNRIENYFSSRIGRTDSNDRVNTTGLNVEALEPRLMLSTVEIFAAGQTGAEELTLRINNQVVQRFDNLGTGAQQGNFQRLVFNTNSNVAPSDIRIEFENDFFDPSTGTDSNLTVDRIVVDGQTVSTNSPDVFSVGSFQNGVATAGFGIGDTLFTNGFFDFADVESTGTTNLTVSAFGTTGEEVFEVSVDRQVVGTFQVQSTSAPTDFTVQVDGSINPGQVSVAFINDLFDPANGIDRNLIVDNISIDGDVFETESPNVCLLYTSPSPRDRG